MAENRVILPLFFSDSLMKIWSKLKFLILFLRKGIVMVDFDPYFLVQFPYRNMVKIEVFHTFSKEKYLDSRKQGISDQSFKYNSLIIIWGKMRAFKVLDDKSIIKADFR